ncbi:GNAT family N-acetyltransferase [Roseomonas sp. AR75]|uniref:GNAT family N-acetyltransferase n=1 Tax=Roseomonas sp. AR75 TaxID=2562311 RepID=UPI0010C01CBB|nr:N-acetyltransferase [Roseomonas sp. AR75]
MSGTPAIRATLPADTRAIDALYASAFPTEDLRPLVRALSETGVPSLVALHAGDVAGHAVFTPCTVGEGTAPAALLGPLAVAPGLQRQGIGSALIRAGLARLRAQAVPLVLVLGDPAYYGRFGFTMEQGVLPPYDLPAAWRTAWQSRRLAEDGPRLHGLLAVPEPWRRPELWSG